jgi:hypothetical protein
MDMGECEYQGTINSEGGWQDKKNTLGMQVKSCEKCDGIIFAENLIHHIGDDRIPDTSIAVKVKSWFPMVSD